MHMVMLVACIPPRYILRLWLAPLIFLLAGLATVLVSIATQPFAALCSIQVGGVYLGITQPAVVSAEALLLRSLASVSCLFMIATTTPVAHIAAYAARYKSLNTVMEIMLLTYRFIFVFLETAGKIYTAQQSRLGYSGIRRSLNSLAMLASNPT
jgi:cobalt/nickel transport system permease protein